MPVVRLKAVRRIALLPVVALMLAISADVWGAAGASEAAGKASEAASAPGGAVATQGAPNDAGVCIGMSPGAVAGPNSGAAVQAAPASATSDGGKTVKVTLTPFADTDATTIAHETTKPNWRGSVALDVDQRAALTGSLTVSIEPLQSVDGKKAAVLCVLKDGSAAKTQTFDVASWPTSIMFGADGLPRGTQVAIVRFTTAGGGELVRALKITRKPAAYTLGTPQKVAGDGWTDIRPVQVIGIPILAPADHPVDLRVHPFQFRRLVGAEPAVDVIPDSVTLIDDGQGVGANNALALASGTSRLVKVKVDGFLDAGRYQAEFRIVSPDHDDKTHTVEFVVRRYWAWILIPVWLGAWVSVRLRRLANQDRPKLVVQQAISEAHKLIIRVRTADLKNSELRVIERIEGRIAEVGREAVAPGPIATDWSSRATKRVADETAKLRVFATWTNARRVLDGVTPPLPPADPLHQEILAIEGLLAGSTPLTEPNATDRVNKLLDDARKALEDGRRKVQEGVVLTRETPLFVGTEQGLYVDGAEVERRLARLDRTIDAATYLVTGILAVLVLWNADPTWGDLADFVTAFSWGLGLGQVSATTFTGFANFSTKLTT